MLKEVQKYIENQNLIVGEAPVLVGLSGGADSVALLSVLLRLEYTCIAVHCNFHLREEESDRDELFASELAESLNVAFYKIDFDTMQYARKHALSVEMAARELRYSWFEEMRQQLGTQAIAVAHHQDDNTETLLLNLIRGTGIRGLSGIRPKNGYVIRPLLSVNRNQILDWLENEGLPYIVDSTNLSDVYTRNFIRLHVLPLLEQINPSVRAALLRTIQNLSDTEAIYQSVVEEAKKNVINGSNLSISKLKEYPAPKTILYELLKPYSFSRLMVEDIFDALDGESGKVFYSSDYMVLKDRSDLVISPVERKKECLQYIYSLEEGVWFVPIKLSIQKVVINKEFHIRKEKDIAYFDYEKLKFPLLLRKWKKGDFFFPFGMKGKKKLSDYFVDKKYSLIDKENAWLLCSGQNIIWIVGERTDNRYRIDEKTKYVLIVKKNC